MRRSIVVALAALVTVAPDACGGTAAARLPDVRVFVPTERAARGPAPRGSELWIYPGRRASLRLALDREGAEDADLVACAGAAGRRIAARIAPASRALVRSPRRILAARLALARACAAA
jgi:hypothetical protein